MRTEALAGSRARLRWLHLILGGALLMPYWLVGTVLLATVTSTGAPFGGSVAHQFAAYAVAVPLAAVTALFSPARPLSTAAARALCGVPEEAFADGPARSGAARARTAGWFALHTGVGALVSGATLAVPPFAGSLLLAPLVPPVRTALRLPGLPSGALPLLPVAGAAMLVALAACAAAAGALLARAAPVLLGPTPADRLAAAERRAARLAERNRLARELHDSVGHALSAVTLQAGAARRVLDHDPDFARRALELIEETTRRTVGELDTVLGLLREERVPSGSAGDGGPSLADLDGLLSRGGVPVSLERTGDQSAVPPAVSREAYRIVQEGLSNALRHAGRVPVSLRIAVHGEELEITMENPLPDRPPVVRPGGGRGLRGVAERAALLGGTMESGAYGPAGTERIWRLSAGLPLSGRPDGAPR
ncbi:sensor histidine kinase [Streptomyces sp. NPDC094448]|uniref:sensor histidine kinase n=1 Tax=Streptomyces sp. NPDC094448 TaxID=3366063 RepID=UPI003819F6BA